MMGNNKKKIVIIGNASKNNDSKFLADGGRIKVALYRDILIKEGHDVELIELENWKKRIVKIIKQIKNATRNSDVIVVMGGPKGSRILIPLVNYLNRKSQKRTVFCPIGIGTLYELLKKKSKKEVNDFINGQNYLDIEDKKMEIELKKFSIVMPQNETLTKVHRDFYHLTNCMNVSNFRVVDESAFSVTPYQIANDKPLKLTFLSRIKENKGILDLVNAIDYINTKHKKIIFSLDVYGEMQLSTEDQKYLKSFEDRDIVYRGIVQREDVINTLKNYFMFVLPTKTNGEGTPGSLIESLIAGVPVLVSSFSQAHLLIKDQENGIIFNIGDEDDLRNKLEDIYIHREKIILMREKALESSKQFLYSANRDDFLKAILG